MNITKKSVKVAFGFRTDVEVARFFETTKQAVGQWGEDEPLPESRQWQLRARHPELFPLPADDADRPMTGQAA